MHLFIKVESRCDDGGVTVRRGLLPGPTPTNASQSLIKKPPYHLESNLRSENMHNGRDSLTSFALSLE
jgi:hypothetical protein